jgi:hypothetical protein
LLPYQGTIAWRAALAAIPTDVPLVLELEEQPTHADPTPPTVALEALQQAFDRLEGERSSAQQQT